ncbi:MAG: phosphoglycerate kinase [Patescibacteria group bacterium]|nr:phosphoglycerate kinase [Patescibacteria group bacterium]
MNTKSIKKIKNLNGKKVLLRVDFNVPMANGKIMDEYKIIMHLSTIRYLIEHGSRVIILSHLGRPGGKYAKNLSLKPIADKLSKILGTKIKFNSDHISFNAGNEVSKLKNGQILMLENLRFNIGEDKNDRAFAKKLSRLGNLYVNDAFACSHRKTASICAIKKYLPAHAGLLLREEIKNLDKILHPRKPLVVVLGGAKAITKIPLIFKLNKKAYRVLIGGVLANNFLMAKKFEIGRSIHDKVGLKFAREFKSNKFILPVDVITSKRKNNWQAVHKGVNKVHKTDYIFDIGPKTVRLYSDIIKQAGTIIWNGPMGMYEKNEFKHGTLSIARAVAARSKGRVFGVAGGGETVDSLKMTKMMGYMDWVSTGGGAMLTYLAGGKMPGLKGIV